jgi:BirA family biotin operon repressor/biotin-[acetyl-CoA-carboxylase] ligase
MIIIADDKKGAEKFFRCHQEWTAADRAVLGRNLLPLLNGLYGDNIVYRNASPAPERWSYAFYVRSAPSSHFDLLVENGKQSATLPDGILCVAGSGHRFHGQRGRHWAAQEGNIHLCIHLSPGKRINHYHAGLPALSAVSLVQTIDTIEGLEGKARIKWVNDVLVQESKVAGFLVHTQSVQDRVMTVILGIGLNVEKTPRATQDVFTPKISSLQDLLPSDAPISKKKVLGRLLEALDSNLDHLYDGQYRKLLDFYRMRSSVTGREVQIYSDIPGKKRSLVSSGIVERIGDNLELWLEGQKEPIKEGRLVFAAQESSR